MIIQSPNSAMPEPYYSYVRQRSETIAKVLGSIVNGSNVQLCPRAITPDELLYKGEDDILYGTLVHNFADGFKSVLYKNDFSETKRQGLFTNDTSVAKEYATVLFREGNRARIKNPLESDGKGQITIESMSEFDNVFEEINSTNQIGVVIMPHIAHINRRISVGKIELGAVGTFMYLGLEEIQCYEGEMVYGGTTLGLFREDNLQGYNQVQDALRIPARLANLGRDTLRAYQAMVMKIGRASVVVIEGLTDNGSLLEDVVDITPRVGGTTPAEVLAIREVYNCPEKVCFAKSQLLYNPDSSPLTGINFVDTPGLVINAQILEVMG